MLDDHVLGVLEVESDSSCCRIHGIVVLISTVKLSKKSSSKVKYEVLI